MKESAFGFEKSEHSPGFLLWQVTTLWQRKIKKALEPYQISHAQFVIMAVLLWFEEQGLERTQVAIVHQSKLDKMTVSKSIKKLMTDGYIHRIEHRIDTRAKWVTLTDAGKVLMKQLIPVIESIDTTFFQNTSRQKEFIEILNQLISHHESN